MIELIQQISVLDALLSNWDGIVIRMGASDFWRDRKLAAIAQSLLRAGDPEAVNVILNDLFLLVRDTSASEYVQKLIDRSLIELHPEIFKRTRGDNTAKLMFDEAIGQLNNSRASAGQSLYKAMTERVEPCQVSVYFATDRKFLSEDGDGFSGFPDKHITCGIAEVTIPVGIHRMGRIEHRKWWRLLGEKDDPRRYVVLGNVDRMTPEAFSSRLTAGSEFLKDILVFLHGYNVTFEEAARRAAQLAFDIEFNGQVVLFSWPSQGLLSGYFADEERASVSAAHFSSFLHTLEDGPWEKVHILAHSMGNRVMLSGLSGNKLPNKKIRQVIFAAADIYVNTFEQVFPQLKQIKQQYTSYVSKSDRALILSSIIHKGARIGMSSNPPFIINGMETIDASKSDTSLLGHGYYAETPSVISDISILINKGLSASHRNLKQQQESRHWDL